MIYGVTVFLLGFTAGTCLALGVVLLVSRVVVTEWRDDGDGAP